MNDRSTVLERKRRSTDNLTLDGRLTKRERNRKRVANQSKILCMLSKDKRIPFLPHLLEPLGHGADVVRLGVVGEAVGDDEPHVGRELVRVRVLALVHLLLDGGQVHRRLDDVVVIVQT